MLEESRAAQSVAGPEIDQTLQSEAEVLRAVGRHHESRTSQGQQIFAN